MGGRFAGGSAPVSDAAASEQGSGRTGAAPPFLPALTGLRIFAAGAVYLSHIGAPVGSPEFLDVFFKSGYVGVTIFFVLSGFVLALNHFDGLSHPKAGSLWSFAVARVARVYPLYLVVLLFMVVAPRTLPLSKVAMLEHVLALQAWDPRLDVVFGLNSPAWSISVEFFLYACFPILVLLFRPLRRSPRAILVTAAVIAAAVIGLALWFAVTGKGSLRWTDGASAHRWLYHTPVTRLGDFSLGILAALLFLLVRHRPGMARLGAFLAVGGAVVIVALMAWPAHLANVFSWDASYVVPVVVLIFGLAVAPAGWFSRFLARPLVVRFGEASYAFYLCQFAVIGYLGAGAWKLSFGKKTAGYELMVLGLLLALSVGLHELVERPSRNAVRRGGDVVLRWARRGRTPPPSRSEHEAIEPEPSIR